MQRETAMLASPRRTRTYVLVALTGALLTCASFVGLSLTADVGPRVETVVVAARSIRPAVLATGQIAHEEEVRLTSAVLGTVEAVHVTEGQPVKHGQLVLAIDSETYAADVVRNRAAVRLEEIAVARGAARISNLERQHERSARLFEQDLLDAHSLETARHELELARIDLQSSQERLQQARAGLGQAESRLEKTRVRAPIDGVVTALEIKVGETAIPSSTNIPGSHLMTIADPTRIIAEVHVDESDIANVREGQQAEIVAVTDPDQPLAGAVEFVANTAKIEPHRRGLSFLARIRVASGSGVRLRPGMSCRAEIFTREGHEGLAVPVQAIVTDESGRGAARRFVFVSRDGSVRRSLVATGQSDDVYQEIIAGVRAGDQVVTGPARTLRSLRDGDTVRPERAPGDASPEPRGGPFEG